MHCKHPKTHWQQSSCPLVLSKGDWVLKGGQLLHPSSFWFENTSLVMACWGVKHNENWTSFKFLFNQNILWLQKQDVKYVYQHFNRLFFLKYIKSFLSCKKELKVTVSINRVKKKKNIFNASIFHSIVCYICNTCNIVPKRKLQCQCIATQ